MSAHCCIKLDLFINIDFSTLLCIVPLMWRRFLYFLQISDVCRLSFKTRSYRSKDRLLVSSWSACHERDGNIISAVAGCTLWVGSSLRVVPMVFLERTVVMANTYMLILLYFRTNSQ